MKTFKKILCTLLVVVMCLTSAPLEGFVGMEWLELPEINFGKFELPKIDFSKWFGSKASAVEDTLAPTGKCGDDVYWNYNSTTGELVISGTGKMQNYNPEASVFNNSNIRSIIIENGVTSIGDWAFAYCEYLTNVSIPESVTEIGGVAFRSCSSLASITIPDSINHIGDYAFYETAYYFDYSNWDGDVLYINEFLMHSKETISGNYQIKDGTRMIGAWAFSDRPDLTGISIPSSVTVIGENAFAGCWGLTSIVIPDSVTTIGASAFYANPYLKNITIGKGVTSIGYDAYWYCGVENVYISDLESWCNIEFANYRSSPLLNCGNLYLNGTLVEDLVVPDSITSINDFAFCDLTSLKSVTFHSNLKSIGKEAFSGCSNLKSIAIPDSVIDIGDKAFYKCSNLADISLGKGVTAIGGEFIENTAYYNDVSNWENDAMYMGDYLIAVKSSISGEYNIKPGTRVVADYVFSGCDELTSVTIPEGVIAISNRMFSCYNLIKVTLPSSIKSIGDYAFHYNPSLCSVNIPDGVTYIGNEAFSACPLTSLKIPDSVTSIGERAFANSAITTITLGNGISKIEIETFAECPYLKNITIPDSVTTIDSWAFIGCENLTSVTIGENVKIIGDSAFDRCDSLTSITVDENNQYYSNDEYGVLFNKDKTTLVQYPIGNTRTFFAIPDSVTTIGKDAFNYCKNLTNVTIGDSVTTIGDNAFKHCENLTSITMGDSVTTIGDWAFCGCYYLTSIFFPNSVTTIGDYAFRSCNSLTSVTITGNATTIGKEAFSWCNNLTNVTIGDSVTTIGDNAFYYCNNLASITIPDRVTIIGDYAFGCCDNLTGVTIPDSVTTIGAHAFSGCYSLVSIIIPDSVTTIGEGTFSYCDSLTSVTIGDRVTTIGDRAFNECSSLTNITIGDSVTTIGYRAFWYCFSLTNVYYQGSKEQWRNIKIEENNYNLLNSRIHFNSNKYSHTVYTSEVTKKSTCVEEGIMTYTCHCGGGVYTVIIPKIAHSYKSTITKAATCAQDGVRTYICVCGDSYTESIPKLTQHTDADGNGYCDICNGFVGVNVPDSCTIKYKDVEANLNSADFKQNSNVYKHDLARFCSLFICVGYNYDDIELISNTLEDAGLNADKEFIDTNVGQNGVNNVISHKEINVNDKVYTLIFVAAIGSHSKQWYSNFDPGTGTTHRGFIYAKNHVNLQLAKYIQKHKLHDVENTKILLTGHSRGAATVNLLAAELIKNQNLAKAENIYTYGFATPNTTSLPERNESRFERIFNIVNPEDFVTKVLPTKWEFGRYGTTYTLPSNTNSDIVSTNGKFTTEYLSKYLPNMKKVFKQLKSKEYDPYPNGEADVYWLMNKLTDKVSNLNNYYSDDFRIDLLTKASTFEVLQAVLCPIAAEDGERTTDAYLLAASILSSISADGLYKDIVQFFIVNQALSKHFEDSHLIATYCAYMMTMSEAEVKEYRYPYAYKKHTVNCPVDIEVYNTDINEVVGRIVDNTIDEEIAKGDFAIFMEVIGDSKVFYLPDNRNFAIKLIGNGIGTMDYTVSEFDSEYNELKRVNFFDVEITDGLTMTADIDAEEFVIEEHELTFENGETLEPTEIFTEEDIETYNINISTSEGGSASSSQTAKSGDYVSLDAVAEDGWKFIGWYENDVLLSTETTLAFVAKSDRKLEAKFEHVDHSFGEWYEILPAACETIGKEQRDCSECDYSETQNVPATGHNYNNGVCTSCGDDLTANCSCNCHAGGLKGIIFKIILFFQKLFRLNRICEGCGARHY